MARTTKPLTATEVTNAKPKDKEYNLADGFGLLLRVNPSGSKTWFFNYYHPHTNKRNKISFGRFPDISLQLAREMRSNSRALLEQGIDPKTHRDEERFVKSVSASNTFKTVAENWMQLHRTKVTSDTADRIWRLLERDAFPIIGKTPVDQLSAPMAIKVIEKVVKRDSLEIARKLARRLNNIMTFAVNAGLIHHNPLSGVKEFIPSKPVQNMATLKPAELPELMQQLSVANIKLSTRCLIEWQLHTMTRPKEAATARWDEIDYENQLWIIPSNKMKMKRAHQIPLTKQTLNLLKIMEPLSRHREYVFPSSINPLSHANSETANNALKRMGFKNRLVAHGMRALASTTLNEQGFDHDVIEVALAHGDPDKIRSAYNRAEYIERRRKMMHWWSEHIEQASIGHLSLSSGYKALRVAK